MNTLTLPAPVGAPVLPQLTMRFSAMMDAAPYRASLVALGHYVEMIDHAEGLSGDAYLLATKDFRYTVTGRAYVVGDGATIHRYSDADACTVIARTAHTLTLQHDEATLLNGVRSGEADALQFAPGGFVGHTSGRQRYAYSPNPLGVIEIARLTKRGWECKGKQWVGGGRHHHYDYNF